MNPSENICPEPIAISKTPLQDTDLEAAVLGVLLAFGQYADEVCGLLTPEAFTDQDNRRIFEACASLNARGIRPDIVVVDNEVKRMFSGADLLLRIVDAANSCPSGADWEVLTRRLQQVYFRRKLFYSLVETAPRLRDFQTDVFEVADSVQEMLNGIADEAHRGIKPRDFAAILDENETILYRRMDCRAQGRIAGINTGISKLNLCTQGWQAGDLVILAGRTAMGKTAVALHFAKTAAEYGRRTAFFSLEMSDTRLAQRLILSACNLSAEAVKSGDLTPDQVREFIAAKDGLKRLPLTIVEKAGIEIGDLCRTAKALHRRGACDLVIVDYLQLVTVGRGERVGNREQEVALVSRRLKGLAKDLHVPVIALAQLSREVEATTGKDTKRIPSLRHLRESGAIEQDADVVGFVYRPAYYGIETWDDGVSTMGRGFIRIAKHRDGELGMCEFRHNEAMTKIFNPPAPGYAPKEMPLTPAVDVFGAENDNEMPF